MASTFLIVSVVFLAVTSTLSLPISSEVETVQLTKSEKTTVFSLDEEKELVPSSSTETVLEAFTPRFDVNYVKRVKRDILEGGQHRCPSDTIEYGGKCMTQQE